MRHLFVTNTCVALLLAGCGATRPPAATISAAATKIQVRHQASAALDSCKKLGPVFAKYDRRPFVDSDPYLLAEVREQTVKLGGDSVALVQREVVGSDAVLHGIAYKCF